MAYEPKGEAYLCFADFEFTCGKSVPRWRCETLSVGIVICDSKYRFVDSFYETCRPASGCKLTKDCMELTNLTQEEIDNSDDSNDVICRAVDLLDKYDISSVMVWGNYDKDALGCDAKMHRKAGAECDYIKKLSKKIVDIQDELTKKMELPEAVNIEELSSAFGFVPAEGSFHNAYNDAMALYTIQRCVYSTDFRSNLRFIELKNKRMARIEAERKLVEENRRKTAFSVPLSEREKEYYDKLVELKREDDEKYFIFLRAKVISTVRRYPDDLYFFLIVNNNKKNVKVIPASLFERDKLKNSIRNKRFAKGEIGKTVLEECFERKKAVAFYRR